MKTKKEKNQIIAELIGWELSRKGKKFKKTIPPYGYVKANPNYLKFHCDWNWLMLAIETISHLESIGDEKHPTEKGVGMYSNITKKLIEFHGIEAIHQSVYEFSEWYLKKRNYL